MGTVNEDEFLVDKWRRESREAREKFKAMSRADIEKELEERGVEWELIDEIISRMLK